MIPAALSRRSQELAAARIPFVTATVVRAQSPTSVEPGSVALVLADGTIDGFVGGVCAEQSVRAYSLVALDSGDPVLLRILPDGEEHGVDGSVAVEDGAVTVRNPCLSGGAIEVFLEPSPPRAAGAGRRRDADRRGAAAHRRRARARDGRGRRRRPRAPEGRPRGDRRRARARRAARAAPRARSRSCPMSASSPAPSAAPACSTSSAPTGWPMALLARIDVPAGIADRVANRGRDRRLDPREGGGGAAPGPMRMAPAASEAAGSAGGRPRPPPASSKLAVDPVCGMTVAAVASTPSLERDGETVLLLLRGLQGEVRGRERACLRRRLSGTRRPNGGATRLPPRGSPASSSRRRLEASRAAEAAARLRRRDSARPRGRGRPRRRLRPADRRDRGRRGHVRAQVDLAGAEVVVNESYGEGCSSSIAAALAAVDPRTEVLVLMLGDQPGVSAHTVASVARRPRRRAARRVPLRRRQGPPDRVRPRGLRRARRPPWRQGRLAAARPPRRRGGGGDDRRADPARRRHARGLSGGPRRAGSVA